MEDGELKSVGEDEEEQRFIVRGSVNSRVRSPLVLSSRSLEGELLVSVSVQTHHYWRSGWTDLRIHHWVFATVQNWETPTKSE